jgi:DNA-binding NtrC family response regulator
MKKKKILIVDDEVIIVKLLLYNLEQYDGYDAIGAFSGAEALEIFRRDPAAFSLVITDLTMPGMSGIELSEEILKVRSDVSIVWCTGDHSYKHKKPPFYVRKILFKPMSLREMAEVIGSI